MTYRMLLWVFGPIHFLVDLVWVGNDDDSQTLRDRLAGTYVIRSKAQPLGKGKIALVTYNVLTLALTFSKVVRPPNPLFSPRGEAKCVRGASVRGACFDRQAVRNAG